MTKKNTRAYGRMLAILASVSLFAAPSMAQDYPQREITIYTTGAGGASDVTARILADEMRTLLGKPVVVQNRPANQLADEFARANPDGYSLMITAGSVWTAPLIRPTEYDPTKDFAPISLLTTQPLLLVVNPASEHKSVEALVAYAKANPGQLRYSAAGIGGASHLAAELFNSLADVDIEGIFYKSNAEQQLAVMRGEVDINFGIANASMSYVEQGTLTALAVTSAEPSQLLPDLPTIAASGVPGYEVASTGVMFAPANTPDAIVSRLHEVVVEALAKPEVRDKLHALGTDIVAGTPEQLSALMATEIERIGRLIADGKIQITE